MQRGIKPMSLHNLFKKIKETNNFALALLDKYENDAAMGIGEFGRRVRIETTKYLIVLAGEYADLHYGCNILDEKTGEILQHIDIISKKQECVEKLTKDFIEALMLCAFSGAYCTPDDEAKLCSFFKIENNKTEVLQKGERYA